MWIAVSYTHYSIPLLPSPKYATECCRCVWFYLLFIYIYFNRMSNQDSTIQISMLAIINELELCEDGWNFPKFEIYRQLFRMCNFFLLHLVPEILFYMNAMRMSSKKKKYLSEVVIFERTQTIIAKLNSKSKEIYNRTTTMGTRNGINSFFLFWNL